MKELEKLQAATSAAWDAYKAADARNIAAHSDYIAAGAAYGVCEAALQAYENARKEEK